MTEHKLTARAKRKGIYILPNLLTTAGLLSGFYAIVASMNGHYEKAAIAIFVAMIFDGLDGRVARLTNTQSAFGAEYDSMADIVSFGIAPALVTYNWALSETGKFGWVAAFVFLVCGALRLARFNTMTETADKRFFQGLNIPSAAAIPASLVWISAEYGLNGHDFAYIIGVMSIVIGILMVSNFKYHSFKQVNWREKVSFLTILLVVLTLIVIVSKPAESLFIIFVAYAISGPITTFRSVKKLKLEHVVGDSEVTDDHDDEHESEKQSPDTDQPSREKNQES